MRKVRSSRNSPTRRTLLTVVAIAVAIGILSGYGIYRVTPAGLARALGQLRPSQSHTRPTGTPADVNAIVAPQDVAAQFQEFNAALTSYDDQPIDLQSGFRLIISKIQVDAPIVERGLQDGWMVVAPGNNVTHFIYSTYPGAVGNSILYSHDGTVFRHLDELAVGDMIVVQTPNGASSFRVRELRIVSPTTLSVLDPTSSAVLTLLTCYPYGVDTSRLAVIADLVQ